MSAMTLWIHWSLAGYLWLTALVSLGSWNAQPEPHVIETIRSGQWPGIGDAIFFAFVTLPALLMTIAVVRRSTLFAVAAIGCDAVWLGLQALSWWVPYALGTAKPWQIAYADGPTTKILPSFGRHVAPDAMHVAITVFLVAALWTGIAALRRRQLRRDHRRHRPRP